MISRRICFSKGEVKMSKIDSYLGRIFEQAGEEVIDFIGKHNDVPDTEFDPTELSMGIEVEKEHVDNPETAKAIAKDHLAELPDYYTRLKKMEEEGEREKEMRRQGEI